MGGLCIVPVGLYLRRSLEETRDFKAIATAPGARRVSGSSPPQIPVLEIFRMHYQSLSIGFCVAVLWAVATYVLMIFLPTYVQRSDTFGFSAQQAFGASLVGNVPFVFGCLVFGALSDRIGRRTMLFVSSLLLGGCILPLFLWLKVRPHATQPHHRAMHRVHVGGKLRRRCARGPGGNFSDRRALDGHCALVYNGAFTVFGGFAPYDCHLVSRSLGRLGVGPRVVCHGGRAGGIVGHPFPAPFALSLR